MGSPCGPKWKACETRPCRECTGSDPGQSLPGILRVDIYGVVPKTPHGYGSDPNGGDCCYLLNGTHYLRRDPTEPCTWSGPIDQNPCHACGQYFLKVTFWSYSAVGWTCEDQWGQGCLLQIGQLDGTGAYVHYIRCYWPYPEPAQPCWCQNICAALQSENGVGIDWSYPYVCGEETPDGYLHWLKPDGTRSGCAFDLTRPGYAIRLQAMDCGPIPDPLGCCCWRPWWNSSARDFDGRVIYAKLSGVTGEDRCNCHNNWEWKLLLDQSSCRSVSQNPPCMPLPFGGGVSLELAKEQKRVTFGYGGITFERTDWNGECRTLDGMELPYKEGTGDGCDYSQAIVKLSKATYESQAPPLEGPAAPEVCTDCPKPKYMLLTMSGWGVLPNCNLPVNFSFLNGSWLIRAHKPNDLYPCDNWMDTFTFSDPINAGCNYVAVAVGFRVHFFGGQYPPGGSQHAVEIEINISWQQQPMTSLLERQPQTLPRQCHDTILSQGTMQFYMATNVPCFCGLPNNIQRSLVGVDQ